MHICDHTLCFAASPEKLAPLCRRIEDRRRHKRVQSGVGLDKCKAVIQGSMQITLEVGDGRRVVRALSQIMCHKLHY